MNVGQTRYWYAQYWHNTYTTSSVLLQQQSKRKIVYVLRSFYKILHLNQHGSNKITRKSISSKFSIAENWSSAPISSCVIVRRHSTRSTNNSKRYHINIIKRKKAKWTNKTTSRTLFSYLRRKWLGDSYNRFDNICRYLNDIYNVANPIEK